MMRRRISRPTSTPACKAFGERIDLWHGRLSPRHGGLKRCVRAALKAVKAISGAQLMPELALAIRKQQ